LRSIRDELLGTNERSIRLKVGRNDSIFDIIEPTERYFIDNPFINNIDAGLLPKDIGYINIGTVKDYELADLMAQFKNTKGIVFDIRNYPMDFPVVYKLSEYLMPQPIPFVKFTNAAVGCPGLFLSKTPLKVGIERTDYYKGKIVILVNEATQSRAEFFAMAFRRAPKAIVMGSQTAGADGDFSGFTLPGGYETGISGAGVYYPDGKETQRIGIVPDIEVKPTIQSIKARKHELLEKAIEYVTNK
jgi:C-terminal processing protease CtpA/Prc